MLSALSFADEDYDLMLVAAMVSGADKLKVEGELVPVASGRRLGSSSASVKGDGGQLPEGDAFAEMLLASASNAQVCNHYYITPSLLAVRFSCVLMHHMRRVNNRVQNCTACALAANESGKDQPRAPPREALAHRLLAQISSPGPLPLWAWAKGGPAQGLLTHLTTTPGLA